MPWPLTWNRPEGRSLLLQLCQPLNIL
jgi:hypothetical protein